MTIEINMADAVVIGAGAVGASIAYEISLRGASVILLDAGKGPGAGCSYANAGLLSPSHVEPLATPMNLISGFKYMFMPASPFYVRPRFSLLPWLARFAASATPKRTKLFTRLMREMASQSVEIHRDYAARGLETGYVQRGSLDIYATQSKFEKAVSKLESGILGSPDAKKLLPDEARTLEPSIGEIVGAIHHPGDAHCSTLDFVRATLSAAEAHSAQVKWETPVQGLSLQDGRIVGVETAEGRITADHYIVAAGLGSEQLCRSVGITLPMAGGKGYVVDLVGQPSAPRIPLTFKEQKVVATPYPDRLRLCGTLELGSKPEAISARRVSAIRAAGERFLPDIDVQDTIQVWAGQRPCIADGIPALGRSEIVPNLVVATGHGMWGLILAPLTAELIASEIVDGVSKPFDRSFSPDRFTRARNRQEKRGRS